MDDNHVKDEIELLSHVSNYLHKKFSEQPDGVYSVHVRFLKMNGDFIFEEFPFVGKEEK